MYSFRPYNITFTMKINIVLFIILLSAFSAIGQKERQISIAFMDEEIAYPFTRLTQLNPGVTLGWRLWHKEKGKFENALTAYMARQAVAHLGNEHHIDQIVEEFQEGDAALLFAIARFAGRLPPLAETLCDAAHGNPYW